MRHTPHRFRASLLVALASLAMAQKPAVETAWQLIAQGKQEQAVTLLRDLIHADPRNADARLLLGSILMEDGQRAESIAQLTRGRPAASEIGRGAQCAGRGLQRIRRDGRGAAGIRACGRAGSAACAGTREPGGHSAAAGRRRSARSRTWIRPSGCSAARPDAAYPHYLRAKIYSEDRDPAKAAAELQQAVELRPDLRRGLERSGRCPQEPGR